MLTSKVNVTETGENHKTDDADDTNTENPMSTASQSSWKLWLLQSSAHENARQNNLMRDRCL